MINKFLLSVPPAAPTGGNKLYTWGGGTSVNSSTTAALGLGTSVRASSPTQVGSENWSIIAAGNSHTMAIKQDGTLWAWGSNQFGQLAYDDKVSWTMVASGQNHAIAIKPDGTLWAVGTNGQGMLGTNSVSSSISPVQIGTSSWTMVKATDYNSFAIRSDGGLFTWGNNSSTLPLIGDNTTIQRSSPVQIGTSSWSMISANSSHVMAIRSDGTLWGWGSNISGQLGVQNNDTTSWTMVAISASHTMAIKSDGTLWGWGINSQGQVGDGTTIARSSPVQIGTSSWTMVATGLLTTLAIRIDGTLWAWGSNSQGQVGNNSTASVSSPVQIGTSSWTMVSCRDISLAIRSDGTLWSWGINTSGSLGDGTTVNKSSPVQIGTGNSWTQIAAGSAFGLAIYTDATNPLAPVNTLWAWGTAILLGTSSSVNRSSPVQIGSAANSWTKISAGASNAGAIRADGTLWMWGVNSVGQVGDGTTTGRSSPVQIGTDTNWIELSAAGYATSGGISLAIKSNNTLWSWGNNDSGSAGNGTTAARSSPVQVGIGISWTKVSAGQWHSAAISSTGEIYHAGNAYAAMGNPGLTSFANVTRFLKLLSISQSAHSSPVQIGTGNSWSYVDCTGGRHVLAIATDGSLWSWGRNDLGGLGENLYGTIVSPIKIGNSSWSKVAVGGSGTSAQGQSYAIRSDGTLWAWGGNDTGGVLGINLIGTGNSRSSPVQIGTANTWSNVFGSSISHYYAITTTGMLYAWGSQTGSTTNLGDGAAGARSSPVQIGTSSWTMVSVGRDGGNNPWTNAIAADGKGFWWGSATSAPFHGGLGGVGGNDGALSPRKFLTYLNQSSPVQIGTSSWTKIAAGQDYSAAIRTDGALFLWGRNFNGRLGNNSIVTEVSPVQIGTSSWTMVSCGYSVNITNSGGTTGAIRSDGALFMWGGNQFGQLGDGTITGRSSPVQIGTSSWTMVSSTLSHTAAIRSDGALFTWGGASISGTYLGDGATVSRSSPVQVGTSSWTIVSTGQLGYTMAIRSDSTLWGWGGNVGQLGDGTALDRSLPVQIGTSSWSKVSTGQSHVLAVRSDGTLWSWGGSSNWQLGSGTTVGRSSPVQIGALGSWTAVGAGQVHSAALRNE